MSSPIEQLPCERLEDICDLLEESGLKHLTSLMKSSKGLRAFIEPSIYTKRGYREAAMLYGCLQNSAGGISIAVKYGCSPSLILIEHAEGRWSKQSTLYVAAKSGSSESFEALLALGARVAPADDDDDDETARSQLGSKISSHQCNGLFKHICAEGNTRMLEMFFRSGTAAQLGEAYVANQCLVPAIIGKAELEVMQMLLDAGAKPNQPKTLPGLVFWCPKYICPLSAAMRSGQMPVVQLLLERGATVDVRRATTKGHRCRWSFPILAAAWALGQHKDKRFLEICIERGVKMSSTFSFQAYTAPPVALRARPNHRLQETPLVAFQMAAFHEHPNRKEFASLREGVTFILESVEGEMNAGNRVASARARKKLERMADECITRLIQCYDFVSFADDDFLATIELLGQRASVLPLLQLMTHFDQDSRMVELQQDVQRRWYKFVEIVLESSRHRSKERDIVLYEYILHMGQTCQHNAAAEEHIRRMIDHGADINLVVDAMTVLVKLCFKYRLWLIHMVEADETQVQTAVMIAQYLALLVRFGADLEAHHEGWTPADLIRSSLHYRTLRGPKGENLVSIVTEVLEI